MQRFIKALTKRPFMRFSVMPKEEWEKKEQEWNEIARKKT